MADALDDAKNSDAGKAEVAAKKPFSINVAGAASGRMTTETASLKSMATKPVDAASGGGKSAASAGLATKPTKATPVAAKATAAKAIAAKAPAAKAPAGKSAGDQPGDPASESDDQEPQQADPQRHFILFQAVPSWAISMLVHVLVLLVLGVLTIADPVKIVNILSASSTGKDGPEIEEFTIEEIDPGEVAESEEMTEPMVDLPESMEMVDTTSVDIPMEIASVPIDMSDFAADMAPSAATLQSLSSMNSQALSSRSSDMKKKLLREYGGNDSSEAAVAKALKWIAKHQMPNGGWTFMHTAVRRDSGGNPGDEARAKSFNAATAMALLPFLGSGQTHMTGEYKKTVRLGLAFLIKNGKPKVINGLPTLDFSEAGGTLYSHGLVAIVLCEAYAMSQDPALMAPAQAAINFTVYAQFSDGGWRYSPRGAAPGDTSVTGWHVMALKSAHMGYLTVPPVTVKGAINFLDTVQADGGSIYGYTERPTSIGGREACTAIGLLCRMYTGWDKNHPGIKKGVEKLARVGVDKRDMYYNYYAAQVLRHHGGPEWNRFNVELRDWLVQTQETTGGAEGSWYFEDTKAHRGPHEGGRLLSTAMATMILEVYYRHMPIYAAAAAEDDFPL
jgi:hypothetical protein